MSLKELIDAMHGQCPKCESLIELFEAGGGVGLVGAVEVGRAGSLQC